YCLPLLALALAACQRDVPAPAQSAAGDTPPPAEAVQPLEETPSELKDVVEMDPKFIVGISYSPEANKYPGLAAELHRYAQAARDELMEAVGGAELQPGTMYDLSLNFSTLVDSPDMLAIAADGSSYTGGAHDNPLIERFIWLVREQKLLTAEALLASEGDWKAISGYVREQLHAALSQRIDADELEPEERSRQMRSAGKMIDEGSGPDVANYQQFEPIPGPGGKLSGLRFVFPPYQVGPYSDGVQTVDVPAAVLLPHVAPAYRDLFVQA
ncbi:MAG: RsiV family protein, partial [Dokdonella sp.]